MFSIFKKKKERRELRLHLNMPLQPMHRHNLEDHIQNVLKQRGLGEVMGGGTMLDDKNGCLQSCDIEIDLVDPSAERLDAVVDLINRIGVAKGSSLVCEDSGEEIPVGTLEGLAYYSNGTELPQEVYDTCSIDHVIDEMLAAMKGKGAMYSYWEGPEWTILYFYGESFEEMKKSVEPFVSTYPLCQKCRIERIA